MQRGPIDVSLAADKLKWKPKPLTAVLPQVCKFYVYALLEGHADVMDAVEDFIKDHYPEGGQPQAFLNRLGPRLRASKDFLDS